MSYARKLQARVIEDAESRPYILRDKALVIGHEADQALAAKDRRIAELEGLLREVVKVVDDSDAWWIGLPDKGGIDAEKIEAALNGGK